MSTDFARPTILIGETGGRVGIQLKLKIDWLCLCLKDEAHHLATDHAIFRAPLVVDPRLTEVPTPIGYRELTTDESLGSTMRVWKVHTKTNPQVGLVSSLYGFEDSPDAEVIARGISSKGPDTVALARHGNFLLWGFAGSPSVMTEDAQRVFVNAISYMKQFHGAKPLVRRKAPSREWAIRVCAAATPEAIEQAATEQRALLRKLLAKNPKLVPEEYKGNVDKLIAEREKHLREPQDPSTMNYYFPEAIRKQFGADFAKYLSSAFAVFASVDSFLRNRTSPVHDADRFSRQSHRQGGSPCVLLLRSS
ncbi:MAG TPA: hypothetical protein VHD36_03280, partial [Pirellulales bacterium]|nr:hypothetical protein [Pirellulales bacterium]